MEDFMSEMFSPVLHGCDGVTVTKSGDGVIASVIDVSYAEVINEVIRNSNDYHREEAAAMLHPDNAHKMSNEDLLGYVTKRFAECPGVTIIVEDMIPF